MEILSQPMSLVIDGELLQQAVELMINKGYDVFTKAEGKNKCPWIYVEGMDGGLILIQDIGHGLDMFDMPSRNTGVKNNYTKMFMRVKNPTTLLMPPEYDSHYKTMSQYAEDMECLGYKFIRVCPDK